MKRRPYPVVSPTGGMDVSMDPVFLADLNSPNVKQVRFHKGIVKKEFGLASHGDANERVMLLDDYQQYDGTEYNLAVTVDKAYKWASGAWTAISGGSPVFTGDEDNWFDSTVMNDLWIVTNGKDRPKEWDGTTWATLGGLSTIGVTTVQCIDTFYSHCIIANITQSGSLLTSRVRWSDTGDPEDWNTGTSGAVDIVDTPGKILKTAVLKDRLFIFKEDSVWELSYVGGTKIFDPRKVLAKGILTAGSVVVFGNECIAMFTDGFYRFDGLYRTEVGKALYPLIFETEGKNIRWSALTRTTSAYVEETGEYVIALPEDSDEPNVLYRMSTRDGSWSRSYVEATALGKNNQGSSLSWTGAKALGTAWNDSSWDVSWKSYAIPEGAYTLIVGQSDGLTKEDDRATFSSDQMVFETKDFVFADSVRWQQVVILAKGDAFTLQYSLDQGVTWSDTVTLTPASYEFSECISGIKRTSQNIRFKLISTNDELEVKWITPFYITRKRSREFIRS